MPAPEGPKLLNPERVNSFPQTSSNCDGIVCPRCHSRRRHHAQSQYRLQSAHCRCLPRAPLRRLHHRRRLGCRRGFETVTLQEIEPASAFPPHCYFVSAHTIPVGLQIGHSKIHLKERRHTLSDLPGTSLNCSLLHRTCSIHLAAHCSNQGILSRVRGVEKRVARHHTSTLPGEGNIHSRNATSTTAVIHMAASGQLWIRTERCR